MEGIDDVVDMVVREQYEAAQRGMLSMWTIFDRPTDWPEGYIARRSETGKGGVFPTKSTLGGGPEALAMLRHIFSEAGLVCMQRAEGDEKAIVEVWM